MVLTMRGLKLLPVALPIILIHLRKVMKHSSSNVCLCLQHTITSPLLIQCWSICYSAWNLRVFQQKWEGFDHKGCKYSLNSTSNQPLTPKEDYKTLKQQWIYFLMTQLTYPGLICGPKLVILLDKYESISGRNDEVLTIRGSDMLPGPLPLIIIHLRKVIKHSSSNGCLSVWYSIPFSVLVWAPKLVILHKIWEFCFSRNDMVATMKVSYILSGALPIILMHLRSVRKDSLSNGLLSLQHSISFPTPTLI